MFHKQDLELEPKLEDEFLDEISLDPMETTETLQTDISPIDSIPFVPGLQLSEMTFNAISRILTEYLPKVKYSAARLDFGSDVLGYDTPQSRDHDWGPRLTLFVSDQDYHLIPDISKCLSMHLPFSISGYPTNFENHQNGTKYIKLKTSYPISHFIDITTVSLFFHNYLNINKHPTQFTPLDWIMLSPQKLATISSGKIFIDSLDNQPLTEYQNLLKWYPLNVHRYLLLSSWSQIADDAPIIPRCGDTGDKLGHCLATYRQIEQCMRFAFLLEKKHVPYSKWIGTAFSNLETATILHPIFLKIQNSVHTLNNENKTNWKTVQEYFAQIYSELLKKFNSLKIVRFPVNESSISFYGRPYLVPDSDSILSALRLELDDSSLSSIPPWGVLESFIKSETLLCDPHTRKLLRTLFL